MAVTVSPFNHTLTILLNQDVDLAALKWMLRTGGTFTASHTAMASLDGSEVSGNGWDVGGELLTPTISIFNTNGASIDFADVSETATGGTIGPTTEGVIYDDTNDFPMFWIDYGGSESAGVGTDFKITFGANGQVTVSWT